MLFASVCTVLVAAVQLAVGTPVQPAHEGVSSREPASADNAAILAAPTCVQGLITPYNKTDLGSLQTWLQQIDPDSNDLIGAGGWYSWALGSVKVCSYNTYRVDNSTITDVNVNHKEIAKCLEQVRDTCCSPTTDRCRAGRADEFTIEGIQLACRVNEVSTPC